MDQWHRHVMATGSAERWRSHCNTSR